MIRQILLIAILSFSLTACGGGAMPTEPPAPSRPPVEEPTRSVLPNTNTPAKTSTPLATHTPIVTNTAPSTNTPAATPTDTALPTLVLPTEVVNPPVRQVWDGTPTYPGESSPGYSFRVTYDPEVWALTTDQFGFPALGHRDIPSCIISVTSGRGLPPSMTVEHEILQAGDATFDMGTAFENGVKKFVNFTGGDGKIITAFEVSFQEESDACLEDAVTVLSTLKSVPDSLATPTP